MFGTNEILGYAEGTGNTLRIVRGSPFLTIQGEGPFTGHRAVFIRLHGCNLRCWFCDTKFDDPGDPTISAAQLVRDVEKIRGGAKLIVITGGEPLRQPLSVLMNMLYEAIPDLTIQIETAGTIWQPFLEKDFRTIVVVSPKTPKIDAKISARANAFKYVINAEDQVDDRGFPIMNTQIPGAKTKLLATPTTKIPIYLSPCDEYDPVKNKANMVRVSELAIAHGHIAGIQLHKILGLE